MSLKYDQNNFCSILLTKNETKFLNNFMQGSDKNPESQMKLFKGTNMAKLQLTGQNLGRVFNCRISHAHVVHFGCYGVKLPNLKLKTRPKQLSGSPQHKSADDQYRGSLVPVWEREATAQGYTRSQQ